MTDTNNLKKDMVDSVHSSLQLVTKGLLMVAEHGDKMISILEPVKTKINSLTADFSGFNVYLAGGKDDLTTLFKALAAAGYRTNSTRPEANSPSWYGYFESEDQTQFKIWVNFSSTVCKRVKIGTWMVEQDVYEISCGDSAPTGENISHD